MSEEEPVCEIKLFSKRAEGYKFAPETFNEVQPSLETRAQIASQILVEWYPQIIDSLESLSDQEMLFLQMVYTHNCNENKGNPMHNALITVLFNRKPDSHPPDTMYM